ncbi:MAG: type I restriction-modification system subunit M [Muribaculum sp.]|nr:type I restriction-modification system subunit M [Muribaculum sp.]
MNQSQYNQLFNFLWNIANDVLVQAFEKGKYKEIIMPMLVLRRLDILLERTKEDVLKQKHLLDNMNYPEITKKQLLMAVTGMPYYNVSPFTMKSLRGENNSQRLLQNFTAYLDGFSSDVQDIINKFDLRHHAEKLHETNRLGAVIEKFTDERINLGITPVLDDDGNEVLPALDNHAMGTLFEQLLRKFNEENNVTEAGEHFTPRDYVKLLADLAIQPIADKLKNGTYEIYDGACGTGGILSIVADKIEEIGKVMGKRVKTNLYGQEIQPDTFATCKADLMLSEQIEHFDYTHNGETRNLIAFGSTISQDGHKDKLFDFCISNPPFGTPWKRDLENWNLKETQKKDIVDKRFKPTINDVMWDFVPGIGDPQMLFLANNVSRMKESTESGTRIVEVHNGSSLFTGSAGGGESNLRRYIIENDLLEAIVAMPENSFYNTGIGTFIWIVTNRKEARRRGKVQLIDATKISRPLRKNLGNKNCEVEIDQRYEILKLLTEFDRPENSEVSKVFPNKEFGYWQITVERPLRLRYEKLTFTDEDTAKVKNKDDRELLRIIANAYREIFGETAVSDLDFFTALKKRKIKVAKTKQKLVRNTFGIVDLTMPEAHVVAADAESPFESDTNLRDSEQVPLLYPGGIAAFMEKEVLPYSPDAWIDEEKTVIGYELSFTKYFYRPVELRPLADIRADIREIDSRCDGILNEILAD